MVAYKKQGGKMYKKKRLLKPKAKKAIVPQSVKAYVQRSIGRNEETKCQSFSDITTLLTYAAVGNTLRTLDFNSVIGLITSGTGEGNRVGTKVKVSNLQLKGWLSVGTNFTTAPVVVKMFVGKLKQALTNPNASTLYSRFYQAGSSSSPPQNNYFDMLRIPNKDLFTIYAQRTFKLGLAALGNTTSNNDFKMLTPFSVNLNKHINNLIFDDSVAAPTNFAAYVWFVCVFADGSTTPLTVPPLVNCCYDMEVKYTDA